VRVHPPIANDVNVNFATDGLIHIGYDRFVLWTDGFGQGKRAKSLIEKAPKSLETAYEPPSSLCLCSQLTTRVAATSAVLKLRMNHGLAGSCRFWRGWFDHSANRLI
jgi:hypothetical protein